MRCFIRKDHRCKLPRESTWFLISFLRSLSTVQVSSSWVQPQAACVCSLQAVNEQRLIYSGKLLPDHLHIKDLFKQVRKQSCHFKLMCSQVSLQFALFTFSKSLMLSIFFFFFFWAKLILSMSFFILPTSHFVFISTFPCNWYANSRKDSDGQLSEFLLFHQTMFHVCFSDMTSCRGSCCWIAD